jgi:hypothetical protein
MYGTEIIMITPKYWGVLQISSLNTLFRGSKSRGPKLIPVNLHAAFVAT